MNKRINSITKVIFCCNVYEINLFPSNTYSCTFAIIIPRSLAEYFKAYCNYPIEYGVLINYKIFEYRKNIKYISYSKKDCDFFSTDENSMLVPTSSCDTIEISMGNIAAIINGEFKEIPILDLLDFMNKSLMIREFPISKMKWRTI